MREKVAMHNIGVKIGATLQNINTVSTFRLAYFLLGVSHMLLSFQKWLIN